MSKLNIIFIIVLFSLVSVSAAGICQYASSASATSQNSGSLATYATGEPNAPYSGTCTQWSGYGYTWSPTNWNVRANLTLKYSQPVLASNFTIFGDYDICWNKMWLKNSTTGQQIKVFDGFENNCISLKKLDGTFLADTVILETCGWSWSSTDAVQLCGDSGTSTPVCGNNKTETGEECDDENLIDDDGCSSECKTENVEVYFVPYVGDFDGSIGSGWYYFYEKMRKWHADNDMKVGFSFYPSTMNNPDFNQIIGDMYSTPETELILKTEPEFNGTLLDLMTYEQVKTMIGDLQNKFVNGLENLGYTDVQNQVTYNQNQARFTETIRNAVHDLGFKIYLEQYVSPLGYVPMLPDFDITQYSVSLTVNGGPGPNETFKQPEQVIQELINFSHPQMIYINGTKVVSFLSHQQDFRINEASDMLNNSKWEIYTKVLLDARKDPRIHILLPEEVYNLRHPAGVCGNNKTEGTEQCDDGNLINGDGCSSTCRIENATFSYPFPKISIIEPAQDKIIDSLENSVVVKISTDNVSECRFSYDRNFDFNEGTKLSTSDGKTHFYILNKPFLMNQIGIYYKCENSGSKINPYSVMHRFSFREINNAFIEICNWYNCLEGAASISIDDGYHSSLGTTKATCIEVLEANNLKGTYFLSFTNSYTNSDWDLWKDVYNKGHEIAGHSQTHNCDYYQSENYFANEVEANINDIINNIGMPKEKITTYAWPCGVTNPQYQEWISNYYLFARGYHINLIESKNPENTFNYKSINSIGIGLPPPNYFLVADVTENYQDWIIYVYHDICYNESLMSYLPTKKLWIEPVGKISKYIEGRKNVKMQNIIVTKNKTTFDLINTLNTTIFDEKLTLKIYLGNKSVSNIRVNSQDTSFIEFTTAGQKYVKFDVSPSEINSIEISGLKVNVPYCSDGKINQGSEECDDGNLIDGDGCSSECKKEDKNKIYVILYVGNIDGGANPEWYVFYDRLTKYYEDTKIPVAFSFFPASINTSDQTFSSAFKKMYSVENIELMQKGFTMNKTEEYMENLSFEDQKKIIKNGRHYYINAMKEILNSTSIKIPVSYVAPFGKFTKTTRKALQELGFRTNFGLYYVSELGLVEGTKFLDIMQYGVSFTTSGAAGRDSIFKSPDEIINQVLYYDRTDVPILKVDGKRVVPLYVHQPDFEDASINAKVDEVKWEIYNETITRLLQNPDVKFVTPNQVWNLRHNFCIPTGVSEAFCNQVDDNCDGSTDEDFIETPTSCGVGACKASGELKCIGYEIDTCKPGVPTQEVCGDSIDNNCDGRVDEDCVITSLCQYASSASADSENPLGSLAIYAIGAPNAQYAGACTQWSGYGYTWSPTNWNVRANLTLTYSSEVSVSNLTIFGDYDICWNKMWLKNSKTGQQIKVFDGFDNACTSVKNLDGTFLADTVILETCGWSWSSTDAVQLCGDV